MSEIHHSETEKQNNVFSNRSQRKTTFNHPASPNLLCRPLKRHTHEDQCWLYVARHTVHLMFLKESRQWQTQSSTRLMKLFLPQIMEWYIKQYSLKNWVFLKYLYRCFQQEKIFTGTVWFNKSVVIVVVIVLVVIVNTPGIICFRIYSNF